MQRHRVHPVCVAPDGANPDLFAPFYPLGCVVAYAKVHGEGRLREAFEFGRITPIEARAVPSWLDSLPADPGVFLLSDYVWNHRVNMDVAREVRQRWPAALVVVGGPHVPRDERYCRAFFTEYAAIDVAVRHEGEVALGEILACIAAARGDAANLRGVDLADVTGLTFRHNGALVRTPDRDRNLQLERYPSPYLTGEFDHWLERRLHMAIETNRGCPYGCTFCDWGAATLSKLARMTMDRVLGEVEFAGRRQVEVLALCDANFGILPRDVEIARHIAATKRRYGYPRYVGYSNAKTATPRLTEVITVLHDAELIQAAQIAMQTVDERVLENVARANIKTTEYRKLIAFFHREGMAVSSDAMLGLPGQTYETCTDDLQFFFDHRVNPVLFATHAMPNAPLATDEYRRRFAIEVDADGLVEATYSFTREEYAKMFELCVTYKLFVKLGLLRYVLYFLQLEHGVRALDFITRWLAGAAEAPARYPISHHTKQAILAREYRGIHKDWLLLSWNDADGAVLFGALDAFYRESLAFLGESFGICPQGSDVDAVLAANREVMPGPGRTFPARVLLTHDVAGYFGALQDAVSLDVPPAGFRPLKQYAPGFLDFPNQAGRTSYGHSDVWVGNDSLLLASNLKL
jgi:radical SAM superfamily enzyme YgiQ (UPF0313 family)